MNAEYTAMLPHNAEAEMAVLGSILLDPPLIDQLERLEPEDFFLHKHGLIFRAMRAAWDRGEPIDTVTLADAFDREQRSELTVYLLDLAANTPSSLYGREYAVMLKRYAVLRKYIAMAQELTRQAFDGMDPNALYAWLQEQIQIINLGQSPDQAIMTWEESFAVYADLLAERARLALLPAAERGDWSWPWASWNKLLDPLDPGMLCTLSAGDGQGKTTFAECIAEHWARNGHKVLFVHFELNRTLMLDRRAARNTGLPRRVLKSGQLTPDQQAKVDHTTAQMMTWEGNITYLHTPGWSMDDVVREARRLRELGRCDAMVVDYLEKAEMSGAQRKRFREDSFRREAHDVELLKTFSEAAEVRLVMLAQLNKAGKQAGFDALDRTGMRGAGEKSEKANVVVLIQRERVKDGEFDSRGNQLVEPGGYSREAKIRVDKNTMGSTGAFRQYFKGDTYQVYDYEASA